MRSGFGDRCFCSVSTIVLKDRVDGLAGAAKLRSNPYVLFPIKLSITATCLSLSISLAMNYYVPHKRSNRRSLRQTRQSFQSA